VSSQRPPPLVLAAFGVADQPLVALDGGQGTSWLAGDLVLKPAGLDVLELAWLADVYSGIACDGFRIARQRRADDGSVCVDGWCATEYLAGQHAERRWPQVVVAGERLRVALRGIPRPGFLDDRVSPWALIYRAVTDWLIGGDHPVKPGSDDPWSPAVDLACQLAALDRRTHMYIRRPIVKGQPYAAKGHYLPWHGRAA
jgi:hypothetical protein